MRVENSVLMTVNKGLAEGDDIEVVCTFSSFYSFVRTVFGTINFILRHKCHTSIVPKIEYFSSMKIVGWYDEFG